MKRLTITGYVGRNVDFRSDSAGNDFATFSVGVSVGTKDNPKTDWVDVSCSGKLLELTKHIKQGYKVFVEGFPVANTYVNKENKHIAVLKLFAQYIEILMFKGEGEVSTELNGNDCEGEKPVNIVS